MSHQVEVRAYKHDDGATITEYKSAGKVWMIKVQPGGSFPPYYLYDDEGNGTFERRIMGIKQPSPPMWIIKRLTPSIKLLLLTDSKRFKKKQLILEVLEQALQGGVDTIVLREKALDSAKLLALASSVRTLTTKYSARLMIHSQADIAKAVNADGVHVDSSSIPEISRMKTWLNNKMLVSASCHNKEELDLAQNQGADFAFLSLVLPTQSHPGAPCLDAEKFLALSAQMDIPIIALGGIDKQSKDKLCGAGLATMGGILDAKTHKKQHKNSFLKSMYVKGANKLYRQIIKWT